MEERNSDHIRLLYLLLPVVDNKLYGVEFRNPLLKSVVTSVTVTDIFSVLFSYSNRKVTVLVKQILIAMEFRCKVNSIYPRILLTLRSRNVKLVRYVKRLQNSMKKKLYKN